MEAIRTSARAGPGRPTRAVSAARREQLLCVGSRIICEQGYHGTSIRDIVVAVGVPKGSFYNYFASKEDFVVEALEFHMGQRFEEFSTSLVSGAASPVTRIIDSFRNNPDRIATDESTPLSFMAKVATEVGTSISMISQTARSLFDRFRDVLVECIIEAQTAGEIDGDKDATTLATFILFSWYGAILCCQDRETSPLREPFYEVLERDILV